MKRVGELVGVDANERGGDAVDGQIELVGCNATHLTGEAPLYELEQRADEGSVPTDAVLEESRLRLVHAHGGAALERGVVEGGVNSLLIEDMAALVEHGVHVGHEVVPLNVGGNHGIVARHRIREGGLGRAEVVRVLVDAHKLNDIARQLPLSAHVKATFHARVRERLSAFRDG